MKQLVIKAFTSLVENWQWTILMTVFACVLADAAFYGVQERRQQYVFSVFTQTPVGPQALQSFGVDNVTHERDGAICFRDIQKNSWGCEKAESYTLEPAGEEQ